MDGRTPIDEEALLRSHLLSRDTANLLRNLCPEALAAWQVEWKDNAAKKVLAEKEWERRFVKEAAFWQRISAWIGVAGAVVGALIAVLAGRLL